MTSRYLPLTSRIGASNVEYIQDSHILVVGAGGIGCEILKNLVMSGFKKIDVIDLDIIDVSNLNRQFLFRPEHVHHPKSTVAAISAMAFNPDAQINSFHQNIKDPEFNVSFFAKYNLVLNALDNVDARRHVNRLCLAADIPLIESGTTGYIGQVMPIVRGAMECYECRPKVTQKVYPICTIRSTPDKPVHCIVWAKELFKLLFGNISESMLYEAVVGTEDSVYMDKVPFPSLEERTPDVIVPHMSALITAVFNTEVKKQIDMKVYKTSAKTPTPLSIESIQEGCALAASVLRCGDGGGGTMQRPACRKGWERQMWNDAECIAELIICTYEGISSDEGSALLGSYVFEKDNKFAMCFVTAASNLRSRIFNIPPMTYHDAKGVAGNIIPAIASTNAIIAGLQVAEAIKMLSLQREGKSIDRDSAVLTYCQRLPTRRGYYLQPSKPDPASSDCYVCNTSQQLLEIDTTIATLQFLVSSVLKQRLGLVEPSIMIGASVVYEEGEDMDDSLQALTSCTLQTLPAGGIVDDTLILVEDFRQDLSLSLLVKHVAQSLFDEDKYPEGFRVSDGKYPMALNGPSSDDMNGGANDDATAAQKVVDHSGSGMHGGVLGKKRAVDDISGGVEDDAQEMVGDIGDVVVELA